MLWPLVLELLTNLEKCIYIKVLDPFHDLINLGEPQVFQSTCTLAYK